MFSGGQNVQWLVLVLACMCGMRMRLPRRWVDAPAARGAGDGAARAAAGECRRRGWSSLIKIESNVAVVLQQVGGIRARNVDSCHRRRRWCNAVDANGVGTRQRYRVGPCIAEETSEW